MLGEGRARGVGLFHACGKNHGGDEGDGERVGHHLVMLLERELVELKPERAVEILEKDTPEVVALGYYDGVVLMKIPEVCERGAEHGVSGDERPSALLIELEKTSLDRRDVRQHATLRHIRQDVLKSLECVFEGDGVDEELGVELAYLLKSCEPPGVEDVLELLDIDVIDCDLMEEAHGVRQEGAHLAGANDAYTHIRESVRKRRGRRRTPTAASTCFFIYPDYFFSFCSFCMTRVCLLTLSSWMAS